MKGNDYNRIGQRRDLVDVNVKWNFLKQVNDEYGIERGYE